MRQHIEKIIEIDFIPEASAYKVVLWDDGSYGVYDFARDTWKTIGDTLSDAAKWANRMNYKEVWGA